jgi:hypothetical protein
MAKFDKAFSALSSRRRQEVEDTQQHQYKWRNDHANFRIFSRNCEKIVLPKSPRNLPCPACSTLLSNPAFKKSLKKNLKDSKNASFTTSDF